MWVCIEHLYILIMKRTRRVIFTDSYKFEPFTLHCKRVWESHFLSGRIPLTSTAIKRNLDKKNRAKFKISGFENSVIKSEIVWLCKGLYQFLLIKYLWTDLCVIWGLVNGRRGVKRSESWMSHISTLHFQVSTPAPICACNTDKDLRVSRFWFSIFCRSQWNGKDWLHTRPIRLSKMASDVRDHNQRFRLDYRSSAW